MGIHTVAIPPCYVATSSEPDRVCSYFYVKPTWSTKHLGGSQVGGRTTGSNCTQHGRSSWGFAVTLFSWNYAAGSSWHRSPGFGGKPVKLQVVCPQNGTAVLKGSTNIVVLVRTCPRISMQRRHCTHGMGVFELTTSQNRIYVFFNTNALLLLLFSH